MAKCIVCSKSAGPFYSLHKACHSVYRNTEACLQDKLSTFSSSQFDNENVTSEIQACQPTSNFSAKIFKKLFIKAWSTQASDCVKSSSLQVTAAKKLLSLAEAFDLKDEELEPFLMQRVQNIEYLDRLQKNQVIEKQFENIPESIQLSDSETIIWRFAEADRSEPIRDSQEKQWTVLRSVMNNMILRSRYKQLPSKTENAGVLVVTNKALYYSNNNKLTKTKLSDIHSITPMKNGVRVQATTNGATPDTYVTGDGRFTYSLLQYAQGLDA